MDFREESVRFDKVCLEVITADHTHAGIGTLHEKKLHLILKTFFCPDSDFHEVGIGDFVADALVGNTILEIQTGGFFPLKKKMSYYLDQTDHTVKIICPVITKKRVIWVDPISGTTSQPHRSYAGHGKMRVLPELVYLLDMLNFERVSFLVVGLDIDDYKLLDGRGDEKKRGATRYERIPRALTSLDLLDSREALAAFFLPDNLPPTFGSADFSRLTGLRRLSLSAALKVLVTLRIIEIVGKQRNKILYRIMSSNI